MTVAAKAQAFASRMVNSVLGGPTLARPPFAYLQLTSTVPTPSTPGTPLLGRIAIPNNPTNFPLAISGVLLGGVTWTAGSTAGQNGLPLAVGWDMFDAPTGGQRMYFGLITPNVDISDRAAVNIPGSQFTITEA